MPRSGDGVIDGEVESIKVSYLSAIAFEGYALEGTRRGRSCPKLLNLPCDLALGHFEYAPQGGRGAIMTGAQEAFPFFLRNDRRCLAV